MLSQSSFVSIAFSSYKIKCFFHFFAHFFIGHFFIASVAV
ncbi:hypothetical protein BRYFOR_07239 [Marvinbryantia formatexigens DSM 14469]|uniref:Uncharacterized protein n=1 Tax=Marvinbryantia formatexigens DSM 14469 TaxID=478749 RepID=C6LF37_9FIRM|nr:hypothetical protein BRYFOR_07239 [Marvinbryantia formatexigens DSM 14469]